MKIQTNDAEWRYLLLNEGRMEYSFNKNNHHHNLRLEEYSLIYCRDGEERVIRYAQINKVRLNKPRQLNNKYVFSCKIYVTDGPDLNLQSFSSNNAELQYHFNSYNQFIRVLHLHLMSKSRARYSYGMSYYSLLLHILWIILAIGISYPLTSVIGPQMFIVYCIVPVVAGISIYKILAEMPNSYKPDLIPYHILPGVSNA